MYAHYILYIMAQVLCSTYTGGAKVCKFSGTAAHKGTDILS